jgi:hypothetical protein
MTWRNIRRLGSAKRAPENQTNASRERARGMTTVAPRRASRVATGRRDTHVTREQSPVGIGIDAQMSTSMPRAEDDVITRAGSRDFHDQPGSGGNTAHRHLFF